MFDLLVIAAWELAVESKGMKCGIERHLSPLL
jgi:hypothetical protein